MLAIFEWYVPKKDHASLAAKAPVEFSKQEKGVHAFHRRYAESMRSD